VTCDSHSADAKCIHAAALDALPDPVLVYDDEQVLYANDAAKRLLGGAAPVDLQGMPVEKFILPDFAEISDSRRTYVMEQGVALTNLPVKIRGLDGSVRTLHVDIRPISFGGTSAALATLAQS
jgi:PAS domain S-box-containing protein